MVGTAASNSIELLSLRDLYSFGNLFRLPPAAIVVGTARLPINNSIELLSLRDLYSFGKAFNFFLLHISVDNKVPHKQKSLQKSCNRDYKTTSFFCILL